jgi:hypothetical protein
MNPDNPELSGNKSLLDSLLTSKQFLLMRRPSEAGFTGVVSA